MSSIRAASTTTSLCVFSPDDLFWKVCMVIPAMSRLPLPIEYHTTTPSLSDVSLFLRMLAVDVFMCSNACGCAPTCVCVESAPHGRVRACEPLSTFYLFIVLFHILSTVSRSLSVLARCHSDRKAVTHTYTCKHADYTKSIHFLLLESKLICAPSQFFSFYAVPFDYCNANQSFHSIKLTILFFFCV